MGTTAELFYTFNRAFLDLAPAAALVVLACLWLRKRSRFSREEKELRRRIETYRMKAAGPGAAERAEGPEGLEAGTAAEEPEEETEPGTAEGNLDEEVGCEGKVLFENSELCVAAGVDDHPRVHGVRDEDGQQ